MKAILNVFLFIVAYVLLLALAQFADMYGG